MTSPKAPKGRQTTAQDKEHRDAALGTPPPQNPSPEGAGQMPVGWIEISFEQACLKITDGTHHSPKIQHPEPGPKRFKYVTSKNVRPWGLDLDNLTYVDEHVHREIYARCNPEYGDVLLTKDGANTGVVAINTLNEEFSLLSSVAVLKVDRDLVEPKFLKHYIISPNGSRSLLGGMNGTAIRRIILRQINEATLTLPPLAEQKRIVSKIEELFSELDAGEESLRLARRQLGVYRQSLLKQAFEGKLTAPWRKQNPHLLPILTRAATKLDSEPGPLPPEWIWQTLNEVADVSGGLTKNSKRDTLPLRIPYLRVANVYANELRLEEVKDIGVTDTEAKKVQLVKGDLLIVEGNGSLDQIGRVAAWDGSISRCGHQNHLIRARCMPHAHYSFVLMFLLSPHGRDVIEKQAASTSGLHTLSVSKVQRLPVPLCSLPEQREIVRLLDEQFTVIEQNEREIDAALKRSAALRQSILKKAFTGQLVPQDPTDEPASALLERIRKEREGVAANAPKKKIARKTKPAP
jgi:type I restriction enzyme S subunit